MNDDFLTEIQSNDRKRQLVALRDLIANELQGNRCKACQMLQIRSGEIASLALRLQKVIEDIAVLPSADGKPNGLKVIQGRRATGTEGLRRQGGRTTDGH